MPIRVTCTCGKHYSVSEDKVGKQARCRCGAIIEVSRPGSCEPRTARGAVPPKASAGLAPKQSGKCARWWKRPWVAASALAPLIIVVLAVLPGRQRPETPALQLRQTVKSIRVVLDDGLPARRVEECVREVYEPHGIKITMGKPTDSEVLTEDVTIVGVRVTPGP